MVLGDSFRDKAYAASEMFTLLTKLEHDFRSLKLSCEERGVSYENDLAQYVESYVLPSIDEVIAKAKGDW